MAAPAKPAEPTRDAQIKAKEDAIKRKLEMGNNASKKEATLKFNKDIASRTKAKKYGKVTANYNTESIRGAKEGFTRSDYGVGAGAAVPYQIATKKNTLSKTISKPSKKPKNLGTAKSVAKRDFVKQGFISQGKVTDNDSSNWWQGKDLDPKAAAILRRREAIRK